MLTGRERRRQNLIRTSPLLVRLYVRKSSGTMRRTLFACYIEDVAYRFPVAVRLVVNGTRSEHSNTLQLLLYCALTCAVYCNRPCLFVCLFVGPPYYNQRAVFASPLSA